MNTGSKPINSCQEGVQQPLSGDPLRQQFERLSDRPFLFVEPGGNWGDMLIYRGAEKLANAVGLKWRTVSERELGNVRVEPDTVIYLHGSGGFNRYSSGAALRALTTALGKGAVSVIQGPMTIELTEDYVCHAIDTIHRNIGATELVIFLRERGSFEALKSSALGLKIGSNFDTAFYLDKADLIKSSGDRRYRLLSCREDNERPDGLELNLPGFVRFDPAYYAKDFQHWIRLHGAATEIVTNRTHSAILGSILGVPTRMFGNVYHKNRSIWEANLRQRGVAWMDYGDLTSSISLSRWLEQAVFNRSWKLQRLYRWFRGVPL